MRGISRPFAPVNIYFRCKRLFFPLANPGYRWRMKKPGKPHLASYLLPMPLHPLLTCPALISAEGRVYRAVICLAVTYWLSGCRPLPGDSSGLASLIRVPHGHVSPIKSAIDAALSELLPMLAAEYDRAYKTRAHRTAVAQLGQAAMVAARRAAKAPANDLPAPSRAVRIAPIKAAPYGGSGRTDMAARQAATDRETASAPLPGQATGRPSRASASGSGSGASHGTHGLLSEAGHLGRK